MNMNWDDLLELRPLRINVGGKHDHHPRRRWWGYVSIDAEGGDGWSVQHRMPHRFGLPDQCVDAALSEHFLEHLPADETAQVLAEIRRILKPGARFRLAVPDMLHPRKRHCLDAGRDVDDQNHLSIWKFDTMAVALLRAGFQRIELLHYWDEQGRFHAVPIDHFHGWVKRCPEHDRRNRRARPYLGLWSTSLIIDAYTVQEGETARAAPDQIEWCSQWQ
jgi:predicted SAM-dependent methyltransferase